MPSTVAIPTTFGREKTDALQNVPLLKPLRISRSINNRHQSAR